jgi:hypothetical protein
MGFFGLQRGGPFMGTSSHNICFLVSQSDPLLQKIGNFQPFAPLPLPYRILPYIWSNRTVPYHTVPFTVLAHHWFHPNVIPLKTKQGLS